MYISKYQYRGDVSHHELLKMLYRKLYNVPQVRAAHEKKLFPPFAVQRNGKITLSIWGEAEEVFATIARQSGFEPVSCVTIERLANFLPEGSSITLEHVSATAFTVYSQKVPSVTPHLYWRRPVDAYRTLTGRDLSPSWQKIYAKVKPSRFILDERSYIPGFVGKVTFLGCNEDLKLLALIAGYTGIGCKTSWSMGTVVPASYSFVNTHTSSAVRYPAV